MTTVTDERGLCPPFDPELRGCEVLEWGIRLQGWTRDVVVKSTDSHWRPHKALAPNACRVRLHASKKLLEVHESHYDAHAKQKAFRLFRSSRTHPQEQARAITLRCAISRRGQTVTPALALLARSSIAVLSALRRSTSGALAASEASIQTPAEEK